MIDCVCPRHSAAISSATMCFAAVALSGIAGSAAAFAQDFTNFTAFRAAAGFPEYLVTADDLPPVTTLNTQYPGLNFGNTVRTWDAISQGGGGTAVSPRNVLFNFGSAPMRWTFNGPTRAVGVYNPSFFDVIRLTFRRADNSIFHTVDMPTGSTTFAGYIASENIAAMEAVGVAGLSNFTIFLDNLEFGSGCARITLDPLARSTCPGGTVLFSARADGIAPLAPRWQIESAPAGSELWTDLVDGPIPGSSATATNAGTSALTISGADFNAERRFRLKVSNTCAAVFSAPASLNVCIADFNCDGQVDDADFIIFAAAYNILDCADPSMPANCPTDLNGDQLVDDADFVRFVAAYNELICP